jgi:amino acid transporter
MIKKIIQKFGTAPVFFTAISTILGAVMFLRFGYAVGAVGLQGTIAIIIIGHLVTIPTAMAIAEISTNQKVEGGGEYYIISRSFGLVIGSTIGLALYLSQAISIAFYVMAFAEAFTPLFSWIIASYNLPDWLKLVLETKQTVGIPALLLLTFIMLSKGADLGVKTLYYVVAILGISLIAFFVGNGEYITHPAENGNVAQTELMIQESDQLNSITSDTSFLKNRLPDSIPMQIIDRKKLSKVEVSEAKNPTPTAPLAIGFFTIFAIIFPAFTGMTAGVGLSGDLKDPGKSIPNGTLMATVGGMIIYIFLAIKLSGSASPAALADKSNLIMADIAWQGWWLIPLGMAAATISSALGSIMVAPRTLQAIAKDRIFPARPMNFWIAKGTGKNKEPFNASIITVAIAAVFILMGAIDSVAEIISMFFMVTYGSLCLISFLNHFAADPAYRPRFTSRWYLSLFGAIACFGLMFFMNPAYAAMAIGLMVGLYFFISYYNSDKKSIAAIFQGVIFQFNRGLHIFLQKADKEQLRSWRPAAIAISEATFQRLGLFELIKWTSQKYGFGTYIHHINGYISKKSTQEASEIKNKLIDITGASKSKVYVDAIINSSFTSSLAQVLQMPSIAGISNNLIMMEYASNDKEKLGQITENLSLIRSMKHDTVILKNSERGFGIKREIHIWITESDFENANLMILLSYIISGHRDWKDSEIKIFACFTDDHAEEETNKLFNLMKTGQLPISPNNIKVVSLSDGLAQYELIQKESRFADLNVVGMRYEQIKHEGASFFENFNELGNIIFVNSLEEKYIK